MIEHTFLFKKNCCIPFKEKKIKYQKLIWHFVAYDSLTPHVRKITNFYNFFLKKSFLALKREPYIFYYHIYSFQASSQDGNWLELFCNSLWSRMLQILKRKSWLHGHIARSKKDLGILLENCPLKRPVKSLSREM